MRGHSFVLAALLMAAPAIAVAQQQGAIEVKTRAEVEVVELNAKGEKVTVRKEAGKAAVVPDDVVIFTTTYRNKGKQPATGVAINNPIAREMTYVDGSAEGRDTKIEFSVDNGKTFGAPAALTVRDAKGTTRKATPADYTAIRWTRTAPLAPGATGTVSFRARVK